MWGKRGENEGGKLFVSAFEIYIRIYIRLHKASERNKKKVIKEFFFFETQ